MYSKSGTERTDESFRQKNSPSHHVGTSPLISILGLDMVKHFVLDVMHLLFLVVMKKLIIQYWLGATTLRSNMIRLSQRLMNL